MSVTPVVVQGTLGPDGTLQLDERPGLPAGRVQVTIQPLAAPVAAPVALKEDWWECLQRLRRELEESGHQFRTSDEIDEEMAEIRAWDDDRLEAVLRESEGKQKEAE